VVRHGSAKPLSPGSNPGAASKIFSCIFVLNCDIIFFVVANDDKLYIKLCRGGGIGRHTGLKILRVVISVPVQVRSSAPYVPLAQLDRAFDYESKGREFESLRARHLLTSLNMLSALD
jgi:hypothetical protein